MAAHCDSMLRVDAHRIRVLLRRVTMTYKFARMTCVSKGVCLRCSYAVRMPTEQQGHFRLAQRTEARENLTENSAQYSHFSPCRIARSDS